jgi:hypothetical protein
VTLVARWLALGAGVLLAGCAVPATGGAATRASFPLRPDGAAAPRAVGAEPPRVIAEPPLEGFLAGGHRRPTSEILRFDLDALPVATWGPASGDAGFTLSRLPDGWRLSVRPTLLAEVMVSRSASFDETGTSAAGFWGSTGGSFAQGEAPACGRGNSGKRLAVWSGFAPAGWTDDGMDVEMNEGDFDRATCSASPIRSLRARARGLVPGYVYAVRAHDDAREGDGEDGRAGEESVVVFLPRGRLVSAGADPTMPLEAASSGAFTRLTFALSRGSAGTASLRVSAAALALWARLRRAPVRAAAFADPAPMEDDVLVGVEVAWQGNVRLGSLSFSWPTGKGSKAYAGMRTAAKKSAL